VIKMHPIPEKKINEMREVLKEYKGCISRTSLLTGVSPSAIKKYARDIIEEEREKNSISVRI